MPGMSQKAASPVHMMSLMHDKFEPARDKRMENSAQWEYYSPMQQFSKEYKVDFRVVLAIVRKESQFDRDAVSERGARGLMQLMPLTNAEVAEKLELESIDLPANNLRAGIFYFSELAELFRSASVVDRLCFALAAYNAGPGRVYDAQELAAYFGEDPNSWKAVQHFFPLLSKRYASLHKLVWKSGRPPSGFFGRSGETVSYVADVMITYKNLKKAV